MIKALFTLLCVCILFFLGRTIPAVKKFLGFLKSKIPKVHSKNKKMATDKKKVKKPLIYTGKIT